jgi:2-polyprenyl-6-methoxyphenol hydroxylase-like FAD-dependent oxidoreductase
VDGELESAFRWNEVFPGAQPEIGFSHHTLEETLLRAAGEAGARVFRPARASIARQREGWLLHIEQGDTTTDVRARLLVAADGKNSGTRKLWGGETVTDPPHHSMGGMLVEHIDLPTDSAYMGRYGDGFSMMFPQGNHRWRIYLVGPTSMSRTYTGPDRIERFLRACAGCFPNGAFEHVASVGPLAFFPNSHIGTSRIDGPFAVAIGDAAGAGDPSQGHGMSLVWRDVRELRDLLLKFDLQDVPAAFTAKRRAYEHVLRTHAAWVAPLITGTDPVEVALRDQVEVAREADSSALGYAGIFANGPDGLPTDEDARAHFFGEHLTPNPLRYAPPLDNFHPPVHSSHKSK